MDITIVSITSCAIGLLSLLVAFLSLYYGHSQLVFNLSKEENLIQFYIKNTNRWAYYNLKIIQEYDKSLIYSVRELPSQKEIKIDFPCGTPKTIIVKYQARLFFFIKLSYKQKFEFY